MEAREILETIFREFAASEVTKKSLHIDCTMMSAKIQGGTIVFKKDSNPERASVLEIRSSREDDEDHQIRSFALVSRGKNSTNIEAALKMGGLDLSDPVSDAIVKLLQRATELVQKKIYAPLPPA